MERLHKLDIEGTLANLNKLLVTTNQRIESIDTKALSQRAERVLVEDRDDARQHRLARSSPTRRSR